MKQYLSILIILVACNLSFGHDKNGKYLTYRNEKFPDAICRLDSMQLLQGIKISHEYGLNCNDEDRHDIYKDLSTCYFRLYLDYKIESSLDSSISYYKKTIALDTLDYSSIWNISALLFMKKNFKECHTYLNMYHRKFKRKSFPDRKTYNAMLKECEKNGS